MKNWQKLLLPLTLSVCIIAPLTNDIFLSGMPEMSQVFKGENISLVISISLFGLAFAQLFYGPFLDRFGRKPVLLAGLLIYTLSSAGVTLANTFSFLLITRFFQAAGSCSAITAALAIARDSCKPAELIRATSLIMAIMGVGPAIAPLIGSFLNNLWGWRASFGFLFILGCFYMIWITLFFRETHLDQNKHALNIKKIWFNYSSLAKNVSFLKYCVISGFSYGVLFSYLSLSPFFIIEKLHYTLINFGSIVALNALTITLMAIITPKISKKITIHATAQLGMLFILSGGICMWFMNVFYSENLLSFMVPMFITTIGIGIIRPTASAGAMQLVESKIAGSASAFYNLFSFISGTIATIFTSKSIQFTSHFGLFIALMATIGLLLAKILETKSRKLNSLSNF